MGGEYMLLKSLLLHHSHPSLRIEHCNLQEVLNSIEPNKNRFLRSLLSKCILKWFDSLALVTTLTKRMAEELHKYLERMNVKCRYIHSEVNTLERINILAQLREGEIDVLIGVNLLREGLDLPEVSLVAILDADKEGFLRNRRSLTQTAGRAARNVHGRVILYADKITGSMAQTIDETERRRQKQMEFNTLNGIEPTQIVKHKSSILRQASDILEMKPRMYSEGDFSRPSIAADPVMANWGEKEIQKAMSASRRKMEKAAENLEFMEAAQYRDEMKALEERLTELNSNPL